MERTKTPAIEAVSDRSALDRRAQVSVAAAALAIGKKSEAVATRPSTTLSAPTKAPQTAKNEVIAVPQAQPNKIKQEGSLITAGPIYETALKVETGSPAAPAASPSVPAVQGPSRTEMLASAHLAPNEQVAASPATSATTVASTFRPELSLTVGSFAVPRPDPPAQPQAYTEEEDVAFKEGQVSTCVKNVSWVAWKTKSCSLRFRIGRSIGTRRIRSGFLEYAFRTRLCRERGII